MTFASIINYVETPEFLVRFYQLLLGAVILTNTLFFWRGGYYFKKNTNYYFYAPFPFIKVLPRQLHNSVLSILPATAVMVLSGYRPMIAIGCFIAAICFFYLAMFCYSAWHHDIFLSVTIFFLSGMYFAFSQPTIPNPFMTLIIFQMSILYFFTGLAKLNPQFLKSNLHIEALLEPYMRFLINNRWLIIPFTWLAVFIELTLGLTFWFPQFGIQKTAIITGTLFHTSMVIMTGRGRTFHTLLPATYLLVILKNLSLYQKDIIWFLLLILLPFLVTFLFYSQYNLTVKEYMQD